MENMENAYNTLRNAETDYKKNQIADPAVAKVMADAENDAHKKRFGIFEPSEEQIKKGQEIAIEKGARVLSEKAEKIVSDMKILAIQKRERSFDGDVITFVHNDHTYKINHFMSLQQGDEMAPDYFQLVSVDGNEDFTNEEEKMIVQKFETALRLEMEKATRE